ncbi:ABC transporter substrate-binding protein [Rhodosalinus halophilus]|uniref:ABC transporter substrate-binding protein n=2 Tax=Rhodosalinus halophilus TaxID=2259333 RepID=A0A365U8M6_9RHOB|nr:ABC transporter substrate-binding protein [Rhodosalinus halophilus]
MIFRFRHAAAGACASVALAASAALAAPQHGIAMYGEPALPPDFVSLPYANPEAPKGGRIVFGETGGFDTLNPFTLSGTAPWQLRFLAYESLLGRSWDEPFTLYGLLAESVETAPDRSWVEFTLRPEARFSDGTPVTVEDVLWSYEILGTEGHPRYRALWEAIETAEATGPRTVRFTFSRDNPELALLAGLRPILKKAQFEGRDFAAARLSEPPIGTAPYVVGDFEPGRFLELERDPDYWGADLPFRAGTHNFDTIRYEYFGDATALFEAFKAGTLTAHREFNLDAWETRYDFPAVRRGEIEKSVIPHGRPSGMTGFVMNTRRDLFADWRVREALIAAFNFEAINDTLTGGRQPRITSYFSNSVLGMRAGPAEGRVRDLLAPFADDLLPGTLEGYALPESDGTTRNRVGLRRAMRLLREAGWRVEDGRLVDAEGTPFAFELLIRQGAQEHQSIADIYARALERLGIAMTINTVDDAQYTERTTAFDFDMTPYRVGLSLSPGTEQRLYWSAEAAETPGSRNWMGMRSEAAEAMIDAMLNAQSREEFIAATRALDRVLTAGRYVIPFYQWTASYIAHADELHYPESLPVYGDWAGFLPDVWWYEETGE